MKRKMWDKFRKDFSIAVVMKLVKNSGNLEISNNTLTSISCRAQSHFTLDEKPL